MNWEDPEDVIESVTSPHSFPVSFFLCKITKIIYLNTNRLIGSETSQFSQAKQELPHFSSARREKP